MYETVTNKQSKKFISYGYNKLFINLFFTLLLTKLIQFIVTIPKHLSMYKTCKNPNHKKIFIKLQVAL